VILGKQIGKAIGALVLLSVFMFPVAVQFSHIFHGDDHVVCNEKTVHIHQVVPDCPICHFHLATFHYDVAEYPDFLLSVIPTTVKKYFSSPHPRFFQKTGIQLRAPPHSLV
jgi:hypothetical protein